MPIPFLGWRAQVDDPFAADGTNWAEAIWVTLIYLVFCLICLPGLLMFLGFSVVSLYDILSLNCAVSGIVEGVISKTSC